MSDTIVWIIIIAFYAPLHYMLPVLILFITGEESSAERKQMIQRALVDSTLSMVLAFVCAIVLAQMDLLIWAMLVLLLSMPIPFLRITRYRKAIAGEQSG